MKLDIRPAATLADEPFHIVVRDVPPDAAVRLSARMALPWAPQQPFTSDATFVADKSGTVTVDRQAPIVGSYDFVDGMGLIASFRRTMAKGLGDIGKGVGPDVPLTIELTAECGEDRATVAIERPFRAPGVRSERVTAPFVGVLYYGDASTGPTVVVPTGSGGDLGPVTLVAALLASHGLNALALAYFEEPGLPPRLERIPLEYVEGALDWLDAHPVVGGRPIEFLGISKGGELSLLLASRDRRITKVAGLAAHGFAFQGIGFRNRSSWTIDGGDVPFVQLKNRWLVESLARAFVNDRPFGFATTYRRGVREAKNLEAARLRVEESAADILLFAGDRDGMWNAAEGCTRLVRELDERGFPHDHRLTVYHGAGHIGFPPYIIPATEVSQRMGPRLVLSTGGTLEANARAQADAWPQVLAFLSAPPRSSARTGRGAPAGGGPGVRRP